MRLEYDRFIGRALMSSVSATVNKFTYDAVKCRERIQFGNYRFVRISGEFHVPAFKCCSGKHPAYGEPPIESNALNEKRRREEIRDGPVEQQKVVTNAAAVRQSCFHLYFRSVTLA
uniref:Uncharacterized protein n=1 Tax=Ascaris lumbricoides TaxID=6252 RepID=A0A0M3HFR5_ASCLU